LKYKFKRKLVNIRSSPKFKSLILWAKNRSFPGFKGVPLYYIINFLLKESYNSQLFTRANSIAFSFIIALFPFLIFLFTLTAYLPIDNFDLIIRSYLTGILPIEAEEFIFSMVDDIVKQPRGTLLSLGFILTLYFASNAMIGITQSFEKSYEGTFVYRSGLRERWEALRMTFFVGLLFVISAVISIVGRLIIWKLDEIFQWADLTYYSLIVLKYILVFSLIYFIIGLLYRYGSSTIKKFSLFTPGAMMATILAIVTSEVFGYYVNNFANYNKFYGSLGTFIILMLWAQFNSFILIAGFELNVSIHVNRNKLDELGENFEAY
jgi:membrane protein